MLKTCWLPHLKFIETQYLAIYKEYKEFMFNDSYLTFSALLTYYLLLIAIKNKHGGIG